MAVAREVILSLYYGNVTRFPEYVCYNCSILVPLLLNKTLTKWRHYNTVLLQFKNYTLWQKCDVVIELLHHYKVTPVHGKK